MNRRNAGFALPAVIAALALVAIALAGMLRIGASATAASRDAADRARANLIAESAIRMAIAEWDAAIAPSPPAGPFTIPWATGTIAGASYAVSAERLFRGTILLHAVASLVSNGRVRARAPAVAVVSGVPLDEFWRDFHSAIVSGGDILLSAGDTVDATNPGVPPPPWRPGDCPTTSPAAAWLGTAQRPAIALAQGAAINANGAYVTGAPPVLNAATRASPADFDRVGSIGRADFTAFADRIETGSLTLVPAGSTTCDTNVAGNWGAPLDTAHPCFDYLPVIHAPGDLAFSGAGQGILIVDGNLVIAPGSAFFGAILVRGTITASGGRIVGGVRVGGAGGTTRPGGTVRYDECALARAFTRSPALRRVYRTSDRLWLPPM